MTTNYSRPLQATSELNSGATPSTAQPIETVSLSTRTSIFDCLKRRKARTEVAQDGFPGETHARNQSESQAVHDSSSRSAAAYVLREQRLLATAKAKAYKAKKEARKVEEKARKQIIGGGAWGFDPTAGTRSSKDNSDQGGCFVSGRMSSVDEAGEHETDHLGRLTGRRWTKGSTWGIEHGGPGKEGKFEHGSLKGKERER